ncbi:unnamed protein product [Strongylus vulgaris]|uniref:Uncharacterized protein n=1 Tax=Strongylus vulgaris TaxID=40348 RepID=A0A3P7ID89_STRVU|nr:unnamed protein product [Strongylus vulgaris]
MMSVPYVRPPGLCFLQGDYVVIDAPCSFEKGVKIGIGGDCSGVVLAEHEIISMTSRRRIIADLCGSGNHLATISQTMALLAWPTLGWRLGELERSNSFSAWESLLEDEPPLYFAVRHPQSPQRHDEVVDHHE